MSSSAAASAPAIPTVPRAGLVLLVLGPNGGRMWSPVVEARGAGGKGSGGRAKLDSRRGRSSVFSFERRVSRCSAACASSFSLSLSFSLSSLEICSLCSSSLRPRLRVLKLERPDTLGDESGTGAGEGVDVSNSPPVILSTVLPIWRCARLAGTLAATRGGVEGYCLPRSLSAITPARFVLPLCGRAVCASSSDSFLHGDTFW